MTDPWVRLGGNTNTVRGVTSLNHHSVSPGLWVRESRHMPPTWRYQPGLEPPDGRPGPLPCRPGKAGDLTNATITVCAQLTAMAKVWLFMIGP